MSNTEQTKYEHESFPSLYGSPRPKNARQPILFHLQIDTEFSDTEFSRRSYHTSQLHKCNRDYDVCNTVDKKILVAVDVTRL